MAIKLRPGQKINGYEIVRALDPGAFTMPYEARTQSGQRVFFKQYKSPSCRVDWYKGYVSYEQELKRRLENSAARGFVYEMIEFFEEKNCFYQVFQFVDHGGDLRSFLNKNPGSPSPQIWKRRLVFARMLMASMSAIHAAKIIHADLKPENIQLIEDSTIALGFQLKIIDMDWSILSDLEAPWHGVQGYVGTPGYMSPEHLKGKVPLPASDVFTCGLMLYELLAGGHPYPKDGPEYQKAVECHAHRPKLLGSVAPASDKAVSDALYSCLDPNPANRPTTKSVEIILKGLAPTPLIKPVDEPSNPMATPPSVIAGGLTLVGKNGESLRLNISTEIGKSMCRKFGNESQYMDNVQFVIKKNEASGWSIVPNLRATNETLLNGIALSAPSRLSNGDILAVGRQAKNIQKLQLTVQF